MSPNPFQLSGAQPPRPTRKAPLYEAPRWTTGLWTNRSPLRDAASTRFEEKYVGPRGDAFLGGENLELSPRLTLIRRPGNSVWNTNTWTGINSFYEFRLFNSNIEEIKTMVDTTSTIYDASNNGQEAIWSKASTAGQSYFQSVGNCLFWGDGANQKKWLNTLQERIPYVRTGLSQNPYNFTPFDLDSFIVDSGGNAQQLIGTVLQLQNFYISNNYVVFTLLTNKGGIELPEVPEVLSPGLEVYFGPNSEIAEVLGQTNGVTLTIGNIVGGLQTITPFFGGAGYVVGDTVEIDQTAIGAMNGTAQVSLVNSATGTGYVTASSLPTTTNGQGNGAIISITALNGRIGTGAVIVGGTGYSLGDLVFPVQEGGSNGYFVVNGVSSGIITSLILATGVVTQIVVTSAGSGYFTSDDVNTIGGSGQYLTVNITDDNTQFSCPYVYSGGVITSYNIDDGGHNYRVGDVVTALQSTQPNAADATFTVTAVSSGPTNISMISGGPSVFPYTVAASGYDTSGSGTGATLNITAVNGSGQITGATVTGGTGFAVNDLIRPIQGSATGAVLSVTSIGGGGSVAGISIIVGGYTPYTVATGVPTTTSGSGTGLTLNINTVVNGAITAFTIDVNGSGYVVGDMIYPSQGLASGAAFVVTSLDNGTITGISDPEGGPFSGYPYFTTMATTGGTGSGATISLFQTFVNTGHSLVREISGVIINGGNGYIVGDNIYPTYTGSSGNLFFTVTSVGAPNGPIASLSQNSAGFGYVTGTGLPLVGGTGADATIDITVMTEPFYPLSSISDTPTVYIGGNPISDSRTNASVVWADEGKTTLDGSALWINRGPVIDDGLVYNWGIAPGTQAPSVVVNNAVQGWEANTYYTQWQFVIVNVSGSNYLQQVTTSGKSGSTVTWSTTPGQTTKDGTVVWTCLANDGDVALAWVADTKYSVGHILEETVSSTPCVFQLQPYSGVMTSGSNFPVYCWQCNSQNNSDVGSAGEIPSGSGNMAMSPNGGQTISTATYSGTMTSLLLSNQGPAAGSPYTRSYAINGDGTLPGSPTQLFPTTQNLSFVMLPELVIPAAGTYTFNIGHINAMFWGIGSGSLSIGVTEVEIVSNILTITTNTNADQVLSVGVDLTFYDMTKATFLNGQTVSVSSTNGKSFTASFVHSDFGPIAENGTAESGATLIPSVITGPNNWVTGPPNTYNFQTGTPVKGYPIMSSNYPNNGGTFQSDLVQIDFPSAGIYPAEICLGYWYHSTSGGSGYVAPTVSPAWPAYAGNNIPSFYMIYSPPGSSTYYNIVPEGIATSSANPPTWPAFPSTIADMQSIAPNYPMVTEESGNYTWWNLGPATSFGWTAATNYTTNTFIIDSNSNREVAYEPGISGSSAPVFATTLYGLVADLAPLVWMNNGPAGSSPSGTVTTTQGGWLYAVALVNTLDNTVSNASVVSTSTGNFFGATGVFVSGGLPAVIDPQVDYVAIFRTDDGGATYYLIPPPSSGNGNSPYTLPLSQYLSQGFTDTTPDANLDTLLQAPLFQQNSVPRTGLINCAFKDNRVWGSVGNTVYWSTGPDVPVGNGFNAFSPLNYAEFPSLVKRLVPLNAGMLVLTVSDVYIIAGEGTPNNPYISQPLFQRIGLLDYNAVAVNGSILYMLTTDKQIMELNVHSGFSQVGWPIADIIAADFDPTKAYLTWHVNGSFDQCLFAADGYSGWYRMSPTAAPESGSITWSLKANIEGGCGAVASVETSPGNIQLLLAPPPEFSGPILVRDYTTWEDNGQPYPANFILGSVVFAYPGQVGAPEFVTTDCVKVPGSRPISLGIRIGEIGGPFETLSFWTNDPPQLPPSETIYNQRFYLSQTKQNVLCRHAQVYGEFAETNTPDELYTLTVYGSYLVEG